MKFTARIKFLIGLISVVVLVGVLTWYLTSMMSVSHSSKAVLAADSTTIGTDYAGLVSKQDVQEGDKVKKGQALMEIHSSQLIDSIKNNSVSVASLPFSLNPITNDIILKANDDGVIEKIDYKLGSYAPSGGIVATINTVNSLYVVADFKLSPRDYARINKQNKLDITLPDNSHQQATVFAINLMSNGTNVDTVIKARIKYADISDFRFSVGTPVQATLYLNQTTWYQTLTTYVQQLFLPKGR
jgi:hypothetical protein